MTYTNTNFTLLKLEWLNGQKNMKESVRNTDVVKGWSE